MQHFNRKHSVRFSAQKMYELVLDIEKYPEYLPFCEDLEILKHQKSEDSDIIIADMKIGYKQFSETYRSKIVTQPSHYHIEATCSEGPLKHLENVWDFTDLAEGRGCEISLSLKYSFRNPLMQMAMNAVLDRASEKFLRAFEKRAVAIYI